jgi:hypothetical protein
MSRDTRSPAERRWDNAAVAGFVGFFTVGTASLAYLIRGQWKASAIAGWAAVGSLVAGAVADDRACARAKKGERTR